MGLSVIDGPSAVGWACLPTQLPPTYTSLGLPTVIDLIPATSFANTARAAPFRMIREAMNGEEPTIAGTGHSLDRGDAGPADAPGAQGHR